MSKINALSEEVINKIAAGEVIERPASVVKELIENSLDAGATRIIIVIEDSGKALIKVTDNGEGMDEEDAKKSILRHTTSKIKQADELFAINTLGFRGEALASIAAVSQLSILTKQQQASEAFNIVIEGGEVISSGIMAAERGTAVEVRNIFFNTPARKKFLKSDQVELRHIIDIVIHYALIHHNKSFKLIHGKHELVNSPAVDDLRSNIASIYGLNLAKDLIEIDYKDDKLRIHGFVAKPHQARNDKSQQAAFINGRWVRNEDISRAVYDAYHSLLFVNKHPVLVLNIDIDPKKIDVNVHPNKSKVKIEQKEDIYNAIFAAVKKALQENDLIPVIDNFESQSSFAPSSDSGTKMIQAEKQAKEPKYAFEESKQTVFQIRETAKSDFFSDDFFEDGGDFSELSAGKPAEGVSEEASAVPAPESAEIQSTEDELAGKEDPVFMGSKKFPSMKILGQIHKTFFVAETLGGLFYIDQHAAHERVLYERFMKQYMAKDIEVQRLLQGDMLEFSPSEAALVMQHRESLEKFGFSLEEFGSNTFVVKTIPLLFGKVQPKEIIYDVLGMLKEGKQKIAESKEEIVTRMACRAAVMAGEVLTNLQMEKILQDLGKTELPYTCPHGRPTVIKVEVGELERKFKRK